MPKLVWLALAVLAMTAPQQRRAVAQSLAPIPDAPQPQKQFQPQSSQVPCQVSQGGVAAGAIAIADAARAAGLDAQPAAKRDTPLPATPCPAPHINWYKRFTDGPQVKPLTPPEKAWLALRNVVDPFNAITVLGDSGIAIASNSHSPYGPGMPGFARNVGVSFTQDITNEFFNTFLICSIAHQDPHYHRMPHASIPRRAAHAVLQVVWTQGDNGRPMPNYGNIFGAMIDDEMSNLYVPGRRTNVPSSAERVATGLATGPIDNFVSEFLPDVASHIHVQIVVIQRIIDQVAKTGPSD